MDKDLSKERMDWKWTGLCLALELRMGDKNGWISKIRRSCGTNNCESNESRSSQRLSHQDQEFPDSSVCHRSKLLWHVIPHNHLISSLYSMSLLSSIQPHLFIPSWASDPSVTLHVSFSPFFLMRICTFLQRMPCGSTYPLDENIHRRHKNDMIGEAKKWNGN